MNSAESAESDSLHDTRHTDATTELSRPSLNLWLWFGLLGGALAWLVHLLVSYALAEFGCVGGMSDAGFLGLSGVAWWECVASVLLILTAAGATYVANRHKRYYADEVAASRVESSDPRVFMARSGVLASGVFVFIIAVQSLPILFYLQGC